MSSSSSQCVSPTRHTASLGRRRQRVALGSPSFTRRTPLAHSSPLLLPHAAVLRKGDPIRSSNSSSSSRDADEVRPLPSRTRADFTKLFPSPSPTAFALPLFAALSAARATHSHCDELAEVCDGLEQYLSQQYRLLQALHEEVQLTRQDVRRELEEWRRCRPDSGGALSYTPEQLQQEVYRLVQQAIAEEWRGQTFTTAGEQRAQRLELATAQLEEQSQVMMSQLEGLRVQVQQTSEKLCEGFERQREVTADTRISSANNASSHVEVPASAVQAELWNDVRKEIAQHHTESQKALKEQVRTVLQRSADRMSEQFRLWQQEMEKSTAHTIHSLQEELKRVEKQADLSSSRLTQLYQERDRSVEIHRFNHSLYQEFKEWMMDMESRMAQRSDLIRIQHQIEDLSHSEAVATA